ncbi:MAG: TolC family protein [Candidatus Palauibacterales bacterium]|nr:TolC family protein [Candidatus Palauibacterales bacterium]
MSRPSDGTDARIALPGVLAAVLLGTLLTPGPAAAQDGEAEASAATTPGRSVVALGAAGGRPGDTLSLDRALRLALRNSPELSAARARLSGEQAGRWADWGAFLPEVTASADFDRTSATRVTFQGEDGRYREAPEPLSFTRKSATQQLRFDWTLLEGGRRILDFREGEARVDAARHRLTVNERSVVGRVKRAYFDALEQQRLLDVARRQLEARREELEITRRRVEAGVATRTDSLGARGEVGRARLAVLDARDLAERERRNLRRVMGLRRNGEHDFGSLRGMGRLPDAGALDRERLVRKAVTTDPEIRALEADARAASAASTAAWTRYVPEVRASYAHVRSENGAAEARFLNLDPSDTFGQLGVTVSWNLFQGFDRRERTGRARAELDEARAERTKRRLEIEKRIGDLLSELRRRADRLEVLEQNFELARERLDLARESYEAGIRTFDDLQVFIDEDREAEEQLTRERYLYLGLWADLEELVGPLSELASASLGVHGGSGDTGE